MYAIRSYYAVDMHHARAHARRDTARAPEVRTGHVARQAIRRVVGYANGLVEIIVGDYRQDGTEYVITSYSIHYTKLYE